MKLLQQSLWKECIWCLMLKATDIFQNISSKWQKIRILIPREFGYFKICSTAVLMYDWFHSSSPFLWVNILFLNGMTFFLGQRQVKCWTKAGDACFKKPWVFFSCLLGNSGVFNAQRNTSRESAGWHVSSRSRAALENDD